MSKIITIKNITEKDISRLREFVSQTPPLGLHTAYTYWVICHFFKDYSYIAESDNKIIGIRLCLRIKDSLFFWQGGVAENFRRQGLAQELINTAVINGKKAGVTKIQLSIDPDNIASLNLYQSWTSKNNLSMTRVDTVDFTDTISGFTEFEHLFEILI